MRSEIGISLECSMIPDVYILLNPQKEEVHSSSWETRQMYTSSNKFIKKICNFVCLILLCVAKTSKKHDCKIIALSLVLLM